MTLLNKMQITVNPMKLITNLQSKIPSQVFFIALVSLCLWISGCGVQSNVDEESVAEVQSLLRQGEFEEALALTREGKARAAGEDELTSSWTGIEVQLLARMGRTEELVKLYDENKKLHHDIEEAAMALTAALYIENRPKDAEEVASFWTEKTEQLESWTLLKIESLIRSGMTSEAIEELQSTQISSPTFSEALLAMATQSEDTQLIMVLLDRALISDPENPAIRSLRGAFFEQNGQVRAASYEFSKALELAPNEPAYKHQLGDFYMRNGNTGTALAVWSSNLEQSKDEGLWFKSWFWNRLLRPIENLPDAPSGSMGLFLKYLEGLSKDEIWNDTSFGKLPQGPLLKKDYQELFWLELIQRLRDRDWEKAEALASKEPFASESLNPELQTVLSEALALKVNGSFPANRAATAKYYADTDVNVMPPFMTEWETARRGLGEFSEEMQRLVNSDVVFVGALLSNGWAEAAIFTQIKPDPAGGFPEWLYMDYVIALRYNRSFEEAVEFLESIPSKPTKLEGLYAEMLIQSEVEDQRNQGMAILSTISKLEGIHGERATAILASAKMAEQKPEEAKELILAHPTFSVSLHGKELLGEIAISQENWEEANRILIPLEQQSTIAKEYRVKRLSDEKNWEQAIETLGELIEIFPENTDYKRAYLQFRDNLIGLPEDGTESPAKTTSDSTEKP